MSGTGLPEPEHGSPDGPRREVTGAWVGYLIFALILLFFIVVDVQAADDGAWPGFAMVTVFILAFVLVPTGGAKRLRRAVRARKR